MNAQSVVKCAVIIAATALVSSISAFSGNISRPPLIRFTGTLSPVTAEDEKGQLNQALILKLPENKALLLKIEKASNLSWTETTLGILKDIVPPRLYVRGPQEFMSRLHDPANIGKRFDLFGYLYVSENRFSMTSMQEAEKKE